MIIDCISDLHGFYPKLEGGDLLIVAGDLTAHDNEIEMDEFDSWLANQPYKKKICIGGNHDNILLKEKPRILEWSIGSKRGERYEYLCDSGTEFEGLKIWGSPWTPYFDGVNPRCAAFMKPDDDLEQYWDKIPLDTEILITHGPPHGFLDKVNKWSSKAGQNRHVGSRSLFLRCAKLTKLKLHVFGHIHESYGTMKDGPLTYVNCSHVNERYEPVNKPIRIEI